MNIPLLLTHPSFWAMHREISVLRLCINRTLPAMQKNDLQDFDCEYFFKVKYKAILQMR